MKQRMRIRFAKGGDLRWISHLDLMRAFERLFRRAGLQLAMSEGYHPKPKINLPSALGLGIAATREVLELELTEPIAADQLHQRLAALAPAGLEIVQVEQVEPGQAKARVQSVTYCLPIPATRQEEVQAAVERFMGQSSLLVERVGRKQPVDLRAGVERLELAENQLMMVLAADGQVTVKPREILEALGLTDLDDQGIHLTRTEVELAS